MCMRFCKCTLNRVNTHCVARRRDGACAAAARLGVAPVPRADARGRPVRGGAALLPGARRIRSGPANLGRRELRALLQGVALRRRRRVGALLARGPRLPVRASASPFSHNPRLKFDLLSEI